MLQPVAGEPFPIPQKAHWAAQEYQRQLQADPGINRDVSVSVWLQG
jgi:hypothetical protein